MNIYVGNLNYKVRESDLQKVMEDYGAVTAVKFIKDRETGRFRGIAFVEMEDAAAAADVLILTVPLQAQSATLKTIKEHTKGKVLLDATVPLETAIGGPGSNVLHINPGSAAERAANILKDADVKVVAAFNNISNSHLANIPNPIECDCLICGDDGKAKEIASDIIEKIPGLKAIDIGPLNKAHLIESITPLLIGMNIKFKSHYGGFRITGIDFE